MAWLLVWGKPVAIILYDVLLAAAKMCKAEGLVSPAAMNAAGLVRHSFPHFVHCMQCLQMNAEFEMQAMKAKPLELAYTALARMAAVTGDGDAALEATNQGLQAGVTAKLRAFTPALLAYAVKGQIEPAFQVPWQYCFV